MSALCRCFMLELQVVINHPFLRFLAHWHDSVLSVFFYLCKHCSLYFFVLKCLKLHSKILLNHIYNQNADQHMYIGRTYQYKYILHYISIMSDTLGNHLTLFQGKQGSTVILEDCEETPRTKPSNFTKETAEVVEAHICEGQDTSQQGDRSCN